MTQAQPDDTRRRRRRTRTRPSPRLMLLATAAASVLTISHVPCVSGRLQAAADAAVAEVAPSDNNNSLERQQQQQQQQHHQPQTTQQRRLQEGEQRNEWPECVGLSGEDCCALIEESAPDVYCMIVRPRDYDFGRIIIRTDDEDKVSKVPARG